jgi:hypothetical protein
MESSGDLTTCHEVILPFPSHNVGGISDMQKRAYLAMTLAKAEAQPCGIEDNILVRS